MTGGLSFNAQSNLRVGQTRVAANVTDTQKRQCHSGKEKIEVGYGRADTNCSTRVSTKSQPKIRN